MAGTAWEEEWELCNDDGFIYKRKKRRQNYIAPAAPLVLASDPVVEQRQRRERKKRMLLKLRDQLRQMNLIIIPFVMIVIYTNKYTLSCYNSRNIVGLWLLPKSLFQT
uniref:Uncharacterized protein n=1 Tax=Nelumbo nucifera TaxID=4432 RepID=A0A822ZR41_NELNU|nr:TPA_asm: hypothetical protein HUJ06_002518 [Nelumbo nucifera]